MNTYKLVNGTVEIDDDQITETVEDSVSQMVIFDDVEISIYERDHYIKFVYDLNKDRLIMESGEDTTWNDLLKAAIFMLNTLYTGARENISIETAAHFKSEICQLFSNKVEVWYSAEQNAVPLADPKEERAMIDGENYVRWLIDCDEKITLFTTVEDMELDTVREATVRMILKMYALIIEADEDAGVAFFSNLKDILTRNDDFWVPALAL